MFFKFLTIAACALTAVAQNALQFTQTPANAQVGQPSTITWTGGDGSPVTLTLRRGPNPNNLATIAIITGNASGDSFTWTPSSDIPPADDYALEITQGADTTNYSGFFTVTGGSAAASTTVVAIAGSSTVALTTIAPSTTAAAANVTSTTSLSVTAVLTGSASSAGTGTALPRNTTFLSQTLSRTSAATTVATTTGVATSGSAASGTASASGSASSSGASAALKANLGMGLGALAAAVFVL